MRTAKWLLLPALAGLAALPACSAGYTTTSVGVRASVGPGLDLYGYSSDYYGDWRTSYRTWRPVTVYESNGAYYSQNVRGARQIQVYRTDRGYVLPPRDNEWARTDRRFNDKKRPTEADYNRARRRP